MVNVSRMPWRRAITAGVLCVVTACGRGDDVETPPAFAAVAESTESMVVTGSPYATEAGTRMLALGGNAVDAAVAAAFALAVAEPTQSGLGGRTQFLFRSTDGEVHSIDGTTQVPASYDPDVAPNGEHGHAAVGIPGTVAALTRALAEHGTLSLATVMAPAITWAHEGIELPRGEGERILGLLNEMSPESSLADALEFAGDPRGSLRIRQRDLASTLERVANEGATAFYQGAIAEAIAEDMAAHGGYVTLDDLAAYEAVDSEIGLGTYRGHALVGSYLPASGVTVIQIMQALGQVDVSSLGEAQWASVLTEALLAGFEDRELAEAMEPSEAVAWLTSDSLASRRGAFAMEGLRGGRRAEAAVREVPAPDLEPEFTSHISVADRDGNVVAMTQSLGPTGGARVVTPGLGFLYASTLGGYLLDGSPGYRPWSSQSPLIVMDEEGPRFVMGGAGGRRIVSALVATLSRMLDQGMDLEEAMEASRLHPTSGEVRVSEGWERGPALSALGYQVVPMEPSYFARLNVIEIRGGRLVGVAQPSWSGASAGGVPVGAR